ncbi:hypothetical protein WHR41_08479 [Cladosporium halotolerans]|uniref:Uncharacterized protein n=1 Tax=Cladosporium halotolerans TaxID=1052096 RepID=A0AB34KGE4_9PEZI
MDRDRRPLDIPPEDRYGSRGQSYRPGGRSPRADSYRTRSPPPPRRAYVPARGRSRSPPPRADTYRRRSPSPRDRYREPRGGDSYRSRPRSPLPIRREDLPRDDLFRRDPEREPRRDFRGEREFRDDRSYRDERDFRDDRGYATAAARSPPRFRERERSPLPLKRARDPSPIDSRGRRSPPPAKRERLASPGPRGRYDDYPPSRTGSPPRRGFSPRGERSPVARGVTRGYRRADSRSPLRRNDRTDPRDVNDWRRPAPAPPLRSPSPARASRQPYDEYDERGRESVATSRRSSPPLHTSRAAVQPSVDDRASRLPPRDPYESREPYRAPRSPRARDPSPPPVSGDRDYPAERSYDQEDRIPPPREPFRADDMPVRAPPTGPSSGYRAPSSSMAPPTGPAAATSSVSAHARTPTAPPSGPRGDIAPRGGFGGPRGRGGFAGDYAPRGRGGYGAPGFRGGRGGGPSPGGFGRGQGYAEREQQDFSQPPSGPRGSFSSQGPPTPFRQNSNSTATTYARSQRFAPNGQPIPDTPTGPRAGSVSGSAPTPYRRPTEPSIPTGPSNSSLGGNIPSGPASDRRRESEISHSLASQSSNAASNVHPALRDLPKIIPGGRKASPILDRSRLDKLNEESERLRRQIEEKEAKKRKALREWDRMVRESETAGVRSELAEEAVRSFAEDEAMGAAF